MLAAHLLKTFYAKVKLNYDFKSVISFTEFQLVFTLKIDETQTN